MIAKYYLSLDSFKPVKASFNLLRDSIKAKLFDHRCSEAASVSSRALEKNTSFWSNMTDPAATLYPLGRNIYASVKTYRRSVKIHISHYSVPRNTKTGHLVASQRGVALDLKEFQRLCKVRNRLCQSYSDHVENLPPMTTPAPEPGLPRASEETEGIVTRQQQVPTTAPPRSWPRDHSLGFYNPHQESLLQSPANVVT